MFVIQFLYIPLCTSCSQDKLLYFISFYMYCRFCLYALLGRGVTTMNLINVFMNLITNINEL